MPVASSGPAASTSGPYVVVVVLTCSGERTTSPRGSSLLLCLEVEGRGAGTDERTNDELQRPIIVITCSDKRTTSPRSSSLLLCLEVEGRGAGTDEQTMTCYKGPSSSSWK